MNRSIDQAVLDVLNGHKGGCKMETVWDRYEAQQPQCGCCELGVCCRHCMQGPCRAGLILSAKDRSGASAARMRTPWWRAA